MAESVGFVHLRAFRLRASRYGGQVGATADLIVSVSQPSRLGEFARWLANRSSLTSQASEGWRRGWDSSSSALRAYGGISSCRRAILPDTWLAMSEPSARPEASCGRVEWRRGWDSSAFAKATAGSHPVYNAILRVSSARWLAEPSAYAAAPLRRDRAGAPSRVGGKLTEGERRLAERVGFEPDRTL
jgi:hypothetical protein